MSIALVVGEGQTYPIPESDGILVARCRNGDRIAFSTLLARYRARIVGLALQIVGQRDDAEDLAQEAFTCAFTSLRAYRGDAEFATWLYRITINLCLQHRRRQRPSESFDSDQAEMMPLHGAALECRVTDRLTVTQTLQELSEPLRLVLILHEMHDLSYDEIARILKIPNGTVASRLSEARRKFRVRWRELESEGDA